MRFCFTSSDGFEVPSGGRQHAGSPSDVSQKSSRVLTKLSSVLFYTYSRWSWTDYGMKCKFLKSWDEHRTIMPIAAAVLKYKSTLSRLAYFNTEAAVRFGNKPFFGGKLEKITMVIRTTVLVHQSSRVSDPFRVSRPAESPQLIRKSEAQVVGYLSRPVRALNLYGKPWPGHICPSLGCINDCHVELW